MKYEDIKTPQELLKFMDIIDYGYVNKEGHKYLGNSDEAEANILSWTLSSPEKLLETKTGHCYDQVELERDWFTKHNYQFKTYFLIFNLPYENGGPTHTLLIYQKDNKYYHFEHSDGLNRGIHPYNTLDEALSSICKHQISYAKSFSDLTDEELKTLSVYEYDKPPSNIDFLSFIDNILTNGTKIK